MRGLENNIKCGKVFSHLHSSKSDILFLQETHTIKATEHKLKASWISQVFHAPFTSHARGVAILFRNTVPFLLKSQGTDPIGRFILISGHVSSIPITLLNIYGSNSCLFVKSFGITPRWWCIQCLYWQRFQLLFRPIFR